MGTQLMAVAADVGGARHYLSPEDAGAPPPAEPLTDGPDVTLPDDSRAFWCKLYGVRTYAEVFSPRQAVTLDAFAQSVARIPELVREIGGDGTYASAIASVVGLALGKLAMSCSTQARVELSLTGTRIHPAFGRHTLPLVWDYAELNPFSERSANWIGVFDSVISGLRSLPKGAAPASVSQADARIAADRLNQRVLVATDPPYFAQIGYADLSDYFYVWLRRALSNVDPDLFTTVATPKADELIAAPYRHGGSKQLATQYFIRGFTETFHRLAAASWPDLPILVVYAHRQEESDGDGTPGSTAWDAMLTAILDAGLRIVGTWPIHAATSNKQISIGANALASYVVLVCRPRGEEDRAAVDRQGLLSALRADLPRAIRKLQEGAISTIDLGQATIGPGMAIFSRFPRVIGHMGETMTVRSALGLIAQVQGEVLEEFVGDLDSETRWAMIWYRDHGFEEGSYDDAEKLFRTTNTSLEGLLRAGIVSSRPSKVRLVYRDELPADWRPEGHVRLTTWEVTQHLVHRLATAGERAAARLLLQSERFGDEARNLAYWLSSTAAVKGRAKDALDYDSLVTSWPELARLAEQDANDGQGTL
jgi:putative DNA methylase